MVGTFEGIAVLMFGMLIYIAGDIAVEKLAPHVAERGLRLRTAASYLARGVVLLPVAAWPLNGMLAGTLVFVFILGFVGMFMVDLMNSFK